MNDASKEIAAVEITKLLLVGKTHHTEENILAAYQRAYNAIYQSENRAKAAHLESLAKPS